jgi:hypothetical protein
MNKFQAVAITIWLQSTHLPSTFCGLSMNTILVIFHNPTAIKIWLQYTQRLLCASPLCRSSIKNFLVNHQERLTLTMYSMDLIQPILID